MINMFKKLIKTYAIIIIIIMSALFTADTVAEGITYNRLSNAIIKFTVDYCKFFSGLLRPIKEICSAKEKEAEHSNQLLVNPLWVNSFKRIEKISSATAINYYNNKRRVGILQI